MNTIDIDKLEAVAKAAPVGPWFTREIAEDGVAIVDDGREPGMFVIECEKSQAEFIATFNPAAVLDLLAELRKAQEDSKRLWHLLTDVSPFDIRGIWSRDTEEEILEAIDMDMEAHGKSLKESSHG